MHEKNAGAIGLRGPQTGSIHPWNINSPYNAANNLWNNEVVDAKTLGVKVAPIDVTGSPYISESDSGITKQLNSFANAAAEAVTGVDFGDDYEKAGGLPRSSYSGSGVGSISVPAGPSKDMQAYVDMINAITAKNNKWAADQAQKQMDFQERMARNAHQYEIEDLKKAGLNPVLSASGGNGASSASGAMAQPDTANSQFLSQMALQAVDSLGNSAVNLAAASGRRSANSFTDKLLNAAGKYVIPTLVRSITKGIFG